MAAFMAHSVMTLEAARAKCVPSAPVPVGKVLSQLNERVETSAKLS